MTMVTLPASCTRSAAEALLPELIAALGNGRLLIDGTGVNQIGQAMLQLLVSARRSGEGASITPSSTLREAAALAGLSDELFDEVTA